MAASCVADLAIGSPDPVGVEVREIYARKGRDYGVYRTDQRICVQFADDPATGAAQRGTIAPLNPLRSAINGLIDGWRRSDAHRPQARTMLFDRQCADALVSALEGDPKSAADQLATIRATILEGRTAVARFQYLGAAFTIVVATYALLGLASLDAIQSMRVTTLYTGNVLVGIAGGALGAFLSIAIALKDRTVLPDLQWTVNLSDAVLRMTVGIVAAVLLICLLNGGFGVDLGLCEAGASCGHTDWMKIFSIGVFAGFFERLVPDLLEKTVGDTGLTPTPAAKPSDLHMASPVTVPDDGSDCLCGQPIDPAEATPDAALPPAIGGAAPAVREGVAA